MRIAAISDINGNVPAFEAVLEHVESQNVDQIIIGGDYGNGSAGFTGLLAIGSRTELPNRNWWRHIHYSAMFCALGWSFDGVRFGPNATTEGEIPQEEWTDRSI